MQGVVLYAGTMHQQHAERDHRRDLGLSARKPEASTPEALRDNKSTSPR